MAESLRRSAGALEAACRSIIEHSPDAVVLLAADGTTVIYGNPAAFSFLGVADTGLDGRPFAAWLHPDDLPAFDAALASLQALGSSAFLSCRVQGRSGEWHTCDVRLADLRQDPAVAGYLLDLRDATERQQATALLAASESRFRTMIENGSDLIFLIDPKSDAIRYASPSARRFLGYTPEEMVGTRSIEYVHPEDQEGLRQVNREAMAQPGRPYPVEYRLRHGDGSWRIVEGLDTNWTDDPVLKGLVVNVRDITKRQAEQRALREQEELFRLIARLSPAAIILTGVADEKVLYANDAAEAMFGRPVADLIGSPAVELYEGEAQRDAFLSQLRRDGVVINYEIAALNHDGAQKWVLLSGRLLTYRGEPAVMAVVVDITDSKLALREIQRLNEQLEARVRARTRDLEDAVVRLQIEHQSRDKAEQALSESEEKYRRLFTHERDAIVLFEADTLRIRDVNAAFTALYGYTPAEAIDMHAGQLIAAGHQGRSDLKRVLAEGSIFLPLHWHQRKDGEVFPVEVSGAVFDWRGKKIVSGIIRDITERRRAEEELQRTLARERELNDLKSRFVAMTSHEFRTPLTAIHSNAELLQRYWHKWGDDKRDHAIGRIKESVQHMTRLMEDVLLLGKQDAGKLAFNPRPLDVVAFCRDLVETVRTGAEQEREIRLLSRDVPRQALLDDKLLQHMLYNLLSNACKYSPADQAVRCEIVGDGESLRFTITDRGIGIPEADLPRLFEPFHRATNVGATPGTGLGLAIVQRCVSVHGGTLAVRSQQGAGTTFEITLPLVAGEQAKGG